MQSSRRFGSQTAIGYFSRPEHYAIARNSSELADEFEDVFEKRIIGTKKIAGTRAFVRL